MCKCILTVKASGMGGVASSKAELGPHTSKEPGVAELKKSRLQAGLGTSKAIRAAGLGLTC